MNAADLALLLDEANHAPWESVQSALSGIEGQPHPRVGWLVSHLAQTKRGYWTKVAQAVGSPPPPDDAGLTRLMGWEVEQARSLSDAQLARSVTHSGEVFTVSQLLRLNARHTSWHAGQIAMLAGRVRTA